MKTYKIEAYCYNCKVHRLLDIPYGTTTKDFCYDEPCDRCGILDWRWYDSYLAEPVKQSPTWKRVPLGVAKGGV